MDILKKQDFFLFLQNYAFFGADFLAGAFFFAVSGAGFFGVAVFLSTVFLGATIFGATALMTGARRGVLMILPSAVFLSGVRLPATLCHHFILRSLAI